MSFLTLVFIKIMGNIKFVCFLLMIFLHFSLKTSKNFIFFILKPKSKLIFKTKIIFLLSIK